MATSDGRCFVYVRYWPGFTNEVPYERFNGLPDNEIEGALRTALVDELRRRHDEIRSWRREQKRKRIEAIKRRQSQFLGRPPGPRRYSEPQTKPRKTRCWRFTRMASFVGWHEVGGFFMRTSGEYLLTPKIWIADVESPECANDLVAELTTLRPANDQEWERHSIANPRYGMVACETFSPGKQASALAAIEQLSSNEPMDWSDLARPILARVNRYLKWRTSIQPTGAFTTENGEKPTNGDAHDAVRAHAERLFPKGVPDDPDLRDVVVKLNSERSNDNTDIEIIREFFGETANNDPKSRSMQGRIRALRQRGGTSLAKRG